MDHTYGKSKSPTELKKRITTYCCVPQCSNYCSQGISFHFFPKDQDLKRKWETVLKMGKPAPTSMRVCSHHFLPQDYFPSGTKRHKLFPHAVPSQKIPQRASDKVETSPQKRQKEARQRRALARQDSERELDVTAEENTVPLLDEEAESLLNPSTETETIVKKGSLDKSVQANLIDERTVIGRSEEERSMADILSENSLDKASQVTVQVTEVLRIQLQSVSGWLRKMQSVSRTF